MAGNLPFWGICSPRSPKSDESAGTNRPRRPRHGCPARMHACVMCALAMRTIGMCGYTAVLEDGRTCFSFFHLYNFISFLRKGISRERSRVGLYVICLGLCTIFHSIGILRSWNFRTTLYGSGTVKTWPMPTSVEWNQSYRHADRYPAVRVKTWPLTSSSVHADVVPCLTLVLILKPFF